MDSKKELLLLAKINMANLVLQEFLAAHHNAARTRNVDLLGEMHSNIAKTLRKNLNTHMPTPDLDPMAYQAAMLLANDAFFADARAVADRVKPK